MLSKYIPEGSFHFQKVDFVLSTQLLMWNLQNNETELVITQLSFFSIFWDYAKSAIWIQKRSHKISVWFLN